MMGFCKKYSFYLVHVLILIVSNHLYYSYPIYEVPVYMTSGIYILGTCYGVIAVVILSKYISLKDRKNLRRAVFMFVIGGLIFAIPIFSVG